MSEDRKKIIEQLKVFRDKVEAMDISPERRAFHEEAGRAMAESYLELLAMPAWWTTISGT